MSYHYLYNNMQCPKCNTEMSPGIAIKPGDYGCRYTVAQPPIKADELEIISVQKCPKCGYSDDGVIIEPMLKGVVNHNA